MNPQYIPIEQMKKPYDVIDSCYYCPYCSGNSLHVEYGFCRFLKRLMNLEEVKKYPPPADCPLPNYSQEVDEMKKKISKKGVWKEALNIVKKAKKMAPNPDITRTDIQVRDKVCNTLNTWGKPIERIVACVENADGTWGYTYSNCSVREIVGLLETTKLRIVQMDTIAEVRGELE